MIFDPCLRTFDAAEKVGLPTAGDTRYQRFVTNRVAALHTINRNRPAKQAGDKRDDKKIH